MTLIDPTLVYDPGHPMLAFIQQHESQLAELTEWWRGQAEGEIERTALKAIEYGSRDLVEIGRTLASCMGRTVSDEEAAELGVYFYLVGKMARWTEAVRRGGRPSDDTLFDTGVYVRMAQRIRAAGGFPGVEVS